MSCSNRKYSLANVDQCIERYNSSGWVLLDVGIEDQKSVEEFLVQVPEMFSMKSIYKKSRVQTKKICFVAGNDKGLDSRKKMQLHTDNAYMDRPCYALSLYCIKPAELGGESFLVDARAVVESLPGEVRHQILSTRLRWTQYDYKKYSDKYPLFDLETKHVRWGLNIPKSVPHEKVNAIHHYVSALYNPENIQTIAMSQGELLLIDNFRMLHGRSSFSGDRSLFRVRYW